MLLCTLKNDGRSVAADANRGRKVRTTKSAILPNGKASYKDDSQRHRKQPPQRDAG